MSNQEDTNETEAMLRLAVDCALKTADFAEALAAYRAGLSAAAPALVAQMPPIEEAQRAIAFAMFREVWNRLPRPERDWRTLPLPKPERNAPCPCGSGRKYKQCCGPLADAPLGAEGLSVLPYVLERIPAGQYAALPFARLSPEELGHVAEQWIAGDRAEEACALIEPLLADAARLDARHEYAFDMLCDAYLELGRQDERSRLVERIAQARDKELRCAALHRRCTMLADEDDYASAWKAFREATAADPDHPALAHLEVILLASEERVAEAGERARYWAARLKKLGYGGERIVGLMEEVARDPQGFVDVFNGFDEDAATPIDDEALDRLASLFEELPAPQSRYRLQPQDGEAGPLEPDAGLAETESAWREVFDAVEDDPWADTGWIDWLAEHPLAWQSFAVIEDVLAALPDYSFDEEDEEGIDAIEEDLLERALRLLRLNLERNGAGGCRLEWGWLENRPALRLLGRLIELERGSAEALELLEWLVLTLNPNDNQGFREELLHGYAAAGRLDAALDLLARYPDDMLGAMRCGRILVLHLAGRHEEAAAALAEAKRESPKILQTLLADDPPLPELGPDLMSLGGEDEAWYYRMDWHQVWLQTGALDWLSRVQGSN